MNKDTQTAKILRLLKTNTTVPNYELNKVCFRYSARIHDLRREGHNIVATHVKDSQWDFSLIPERLVENE